MQLQNELDLYDAYIMYVFSDVSSVVPFPSIRSLSLNFQAIKVILPSNDKAFVPLSNIYQPRII